jgi:parallel beta-helix repeat protein
MIALRWSGAPLFAVLLTSAFGCENELGPPFTEHDGGFEEPDALSFVELDSRAGSNDGQAGQAVDSRFIDTNADARLQSDRPPDNVTVTPTTRVRDANGCTIYVAKDGADSKNGGLTDPYGTLLRAVRLMRPGDTICVRAGTYAGFTAGRLRGSAEHPMVIRSFPGERVVLDGAIRGGHIIGLSDAAGHLTIEGFELTNSRYDVNGGPQNGIKCTCDERVPGQPATCVDWGGPLLLRNLYVHHVTYRGIQLTMSDVTLIGNRIEHTGSADGYGLWLNGYRFHVKGNTVSNSGAGSGITAHSPFSDSTIEGNILFDTSNGGASDAAIRISSGRRNIVRNNIIYGNTIGGIALSSVREDLVYNNTIVGARSVGVAATATDFVRNNIIIGSVRAVSGGKAERNLSDQDPMFVNAAGHDFHVRPGSPAIDKGMVLPEVTTDFDGRTRPSRGAYDIGAFEAP